MPRSLVVAFFLLAIIAVSSPLSASTAPVSRTTTVYDTIDALEVIDNQLAVTGIIAGQSAPSEFRYSVSLTTDMTAASRCDRVALLAMTKPGKYQFAVVFEAGASRGACKLIIRNP